MKKTIIKAVAVCLLLTLSLSIAACGDDIYRGGAVPTAPQTPDPSGSGDVVKQISVDKMLMNEEECEVIPAAQVQQIGSGMTDGEYNYFYFKIGQIYNVPVHYEAAYRHTGIARKYVWETAKITSQTYASSVQKTASMSASASVQFSINAKTEGKLSASYSGVSAGVTSSLSAGLTTTLSSTGTVTTQESFTESVNDIIQETQRIEVIIEEEHPAGYYRYVMYANFDLYVTLICDVQEKTIQYTYVAIPREKSYFTAMRYSERNDFDEATASTQITLAENAFDSFDIDYFDSSVLKPLDGVYATARYANYTNREIDDTGYYGLGHPDQAEYLDLSTLEKYMTKHYVFEFHVTVDGQEYWDQKGYHEMHLYNKLIDAPIDMEIGETEAAEIYGWLGEYIWEEDDVHTHTWRVRGDDCRKWMYILYDAHGEGEDNWRLQSIQVDIEVRAAK